MGGGAANASFRILKVVFVLFQLPAKVERMSSRCLTLKPAPIWPSLPSSTSRCASVLTLTRSSAWVQVRPPPICPLTRCHSLTGNGETSSKSTMKTVDPINGDDSFKMAPDAFRLLNFNRPPSVAFTVARAAVELSVLVTQWDL